MNYQEKIEALLDEQSRNWGLLKKNLEGLKKARTREFHFDGFSFKVQFNPERIVSSSAKVDKESITNRNCFLCSENRPPEQEKVLYKEKYEFLCNPFPIFERHFTLSHLNHKAQEIGSVFGDFLEISRDLPELVIFYNAPGCGASAPDHLHFQAGNKGLMPIETDLDKLIEMYGSCIGLTDSLCVHAIDDGLRRFFMVESDSISGLREVFYPIHEVCSAFTDEEEPMLNILSYFQKGSWRVIFFLREMHRPWQYFEEGENNILLSPASVDYGGTLITPLEKDFEKLKSQDIISIFKQTSLRPEKFRILQDVLKTSIINK
jgi:hypothetical protein